MAGRVMNESDSLLEAARRVWSNAYVPASGFRVGAAVLGEDGTVHAGCNVENASYGLTICAERAAVARAVAEGTTRIRAVAVYTDLDVPARPCGACRQVLAEFGADMAVHLAGRDGTVETVSLGELLPEPFTFASFRGGRAP